MLAKIISHSKLAIITVIFSAFISKAMSQFNGEIQPFATGKWVYISVGKGGFFKIGYEELQQYGLNPSQINPRTIRLFASQGAGYPDINGAVTSSAPEVPIFVSGESDGTFDKGDYIVFYIEPLVSFEPDNVRFNRNRHQYAQNIVAYLGTDNSTNGKRVNLLSNNSQGNVPIIYGGCVLDLIENDIQNPLGMGRVWLGEKLGNETLNRTYNTQIPNGADSTWLQFRIGASMVDETGNLNFKYGNLNFDLFLRRNISGDEPVYTQQFQLQTTETGNLPLSLSLTRKNSQSAAYLDYLLLQSFGKHQNITATDWYYPQLKNEDVSKGVFFEF